MKQRILVLGAGGFVGRRLMENLALVDWASPLAPRHRAPACPAQAGAGSLDATDARQLAAAMHGVDAVVNAVAGSPATIAANAKALFAAAAAQAAPPRIVLLSSMAVYGPATGVVDEHAPLNAGGGYAAAKVESERCAGRYPRAVILRPGCVYGPHSRQWSDRIAGWLRTARIGNLGDAGEGCCNLLHVDDLAGAIVAALRRPAVEGETFNLAVPAPPTWNEYFLLVAQALGALPLRSVPHLRLTFESRLLAPLLKIAQRATESAGLDSRWLPEPIPPSLLRLFRQRISLDTNKARELLGLRCTPLAEGIRAALAGSPAGAAAMAAR